MSDAIACTNIGKKGRQMRLRVGLVGAVVAVALLGAGLAADWSWGLRALVALPAAMAAISLLQVRRGVCVAHAATGSLEDDDLRVTKVAQPSLASALRAAGRRIVTHGVLIGAAAGALSAATAFLH